MRAIQDRLLWLEGAQEYYHSYDYVQRLKKFFKNETQPIWQDILVNGSLSQLHRLLIQISALEVDDQIEIVNLISSDNIKFSDYIAKNSDMESLPIFLKIIEKFPKDVQFDIFFKYPNKSSKDFFSMLVANKSQTNVVKCFLNYINQFSLLEKINFLQATKINHLTFALLIAEGQISLIENGFSSFTLFFQKLIQDFKIRDQHIDLIDIYEEIFYTKREIKLFYEAICSHQSSGNLFAFIYNECVPEEHLKYFLKERDIIWQGILTLSMSEQINILSEIAENKGRWAKIFCDFQGPFYMVEQFRWRNKIDEYYKTLKSSSHYSSAENSSYTVMTSAMIEAVAMPIECIQTHKQVEPSAPSAATLLNDIQLSDEVEEQHSLNCSLGFSSMK